MTVNEAMQDYIFLYEEIKRNFWDPKLTTIQKENRKKELLLQRNSKAKTDYLWKCPGIGYTVSGDAFVSNINIGTHEVKGFLGIKYRTKCYEISVGIRGCHKSKPLLVPLSNANKYISSCGVGSIVRFKANMHIFSYHEEFDTDDSFAVSFSDYTIFDIHP